jgi:hypothetical protein
MLQRKIAPDDALQRVEAAIAEFEQRPDRLRCAALLDALYRQREQLAPGRKREPEELASANAPLS